MATGRKKGEEKRKESAPRFDIRRKREFFDHVKTESEKITNVDELKKLYQFSFESVVDKFAQQNSELIKQLLANSEKLDQVPML